MFSDRMVFVRAVHEARWMDDMELAVYDSWCAPLYCTLAIRLRLGARCFTRGHTHLLLGTWPSFRSSWSHQGACEPHFCWLTKQRSHVEALRNNQNPWCHTHTPISFPGELHMFLTHNAPCCDQKISCLRPPRRFDSMVAQLPDVVPDAIVYLHASPVTCAHCLA